MLNSLAAGALAGSLCGCAGAICSRMRLSTIAFAIAHAALAGSAISLLLGQEPILLGILLAILTSLILGPISDRLRMPLDTTSMMLFSIYNALTFISLVLSPGPTLASEKVGRILWGSILAVTPSYLIVLLSLAALYLLVLRMFWGRVYSILFDSRLAEAEGVNVKLYTYMLMTLAGVIIVFALRITGGFLVFSLLFIPSASSLQVSESLKKRIMTASIIGAISSILGILLSFSLNLPVGSCIVIGAAAIFSILALISAVKRRIW